MEVKSTSDFRHQLTKINKKKKQYACIETQIKSLFSNNSFAQIVQMNYFLRDVGEFKLLKIRLPNPTMQKGRSGGYRLITLLNTQLETTTLLYIYPKVGKLKKDNITDDEEMKFLKHYFKELDNKELEVFKLTK